MPTRHPPAPGGGGRCRGGDLPTLKLGGPEPGCPPARAGCSWCCSRSYWPWVSPGSPPGPRGGGRARPPTRPARAARPGRRRAPSRRGVPPAGRSGSPIGGARTSGRVPPTEARRATRDLARAPAQAQARRTARRQAVRRRATAQAPMSPLAPAAPVVVHLAAARLPGASAVRPAGPALAWVVEGSARGCPEHPAGCRVAAAPREEAGHRRAGRRQETEEVAAARHPACPRVRPTSAVAGRRVHQAPPAARVPLVPPAVRVSAVRPHRLPALPQRNSAAPRRPPRRPWPTPAPTSSCA